MRHRIIQHAGRRYSLKFDELSWQTLEALARAEGLRLNQLIAGIAAKQGRGNLTAALRQLCLERAVQRVAALELQVAALSRPGRGAAIPAIVEGMPTPCFLMSHRHEILRANGPAARWIGMDKAALIGQSVERYLQIQSTLTLEKIVAEFGKGTAKIFPARIICPRPGRLMIARGMICPALVRSADDLAYVLMIDLRTAN